MILAIEKKKREEVKLRKKENLVEKTPRRARRHAVPLAMTKRKKKRGILRTFAVYILSRDNNLSVKKRKKKE